MEGYRAFQHLSAANAEAVTSRGAVICEHGRPKGICGECFPTETKIDRDREFDQTAKTEPDRVCPVYRSAECPRPANTTEPPAAIGTHAERRVSPSILEFQNQELTRNNFQLSEKIIDLVEKLRVATERIAGFERMSNNISQKLDEFEREFMAVTGKTPAAVAITVESLPYFEDDQVCGYCNRQPGERHARNCRQ